MFFGLHITFAMSFCVKNVSHADIFKSRDVCKMSRVKL